MFGKQFVFFLTMEPDLKIQGTPNFMRLKKYKVCRLSQTPIKGEIAIYRIFCDNLLSDVRTLL
jgi:hypothetical protein